MFIYDACKESVPKHFISQLRAQTINTFNTMPKIYVFILYYYIIIYIYIILKSFLCSPSCSFWSSPLCRDTFRLPPGGWRPLWFPPLRGARGQTCPPGLGDRQTMPPPLRTRTLGSKVEIKYNVIWLYKFSLAQTVGAISLHFQRKISLIFSSVIFTHTKKITVMRNLWKNIARGLEGNKSVISHLLRQLIIMIIIKEISI